jgi:hypothetical protein
MKFNFDIPDRSEAAILSKRKSEYFWKNYLTSMG